MSRRKGLGRGFNTLIPTGSFEDDLDSTLGEDTKSDLKQLKISDVHPDLEQPRRDFDEESLKELSASIKEHGVLQPIVVTVDADGGYKIVAGERRYRASKMAEMEKIPALVRTMTDQNRLEVSLIENIQRRDLNPLETAMAYLRLQNQFNLTDKEIGERVGGKSATAVNNTIRILKLPEFALKHLSSGEITETQARALLGLSEVDIEYLLERIMQEKWSVRRIEQVTREMKQKQKLAKKPNSGNKNQNITRYADEVEVLKKKFESDKVKITTNKMGGGKLILPFKSEEEFEKIIKLIK